MRLIILALTVMLGTSLNVIAATPEYAQEKFNAITGELYWDINAEVRLLYIPKCRVSNSWDKTMESVLYGIMHSVDLFSILGDTEHSLVCGQRGLRAVYRLREDGLFPSEYGKNIKLNNLNITYHKTRRPLMFGSSDIENFQEVFSALQTNTPVIASIYSDIYYSEFSSARLEARAIINFKNLDMSDRLSRSMVQAEIDDRKSWLLAKYFYIVLQIISALFLLIVAIKYYRSRFHPMLSNRLTSLKVHIQKIYDSITKKLSTRSKIIKIEKFKSYSVADELLKWAKLKENGLVTEDEYQEARQKIMGNE